LRHAPFSPFTFHQSLLTFPRVSQRYLEPFLIFLRLGLTSFGGPIAHLGYFRQEFVERRGWLTEQSFADLVALCQFLPGPTSSQVCYSIGMIRSGLFGAIASWFGFTLPSGLLMILAAYGIHWTGNPQAGYGFAQALPGPIFSFAAYLGAAKTGYPSGWPAGLWALFAILLPPTLLVNGLLPLWSRLRSSPAAQAALAGANATVVGILLAAFYQPIWTSAIDSPKSFALALVLFAALQFWNVAPWILVIAGAVCSGLLLQ
jgi:chromate transport protein ChrA